MNDEPFDPLSITDQDELFRILDEMEQDVDQVFPLQEMINHLSQRILGQADVIREVAKFVRQGMAKVERRTPIASLLFVGPPATGKTEMAKAMTEFLFDNEEHILQFNCADFKDPHNASRLVGPPPGIVGAADGGQLTKPVIQNGKRLVLFDELEKAHADVLTSLLSLMGQGYLDEQGTGMRADFTDAVIVMTSNQSFEAILNIAEEIRDQEERDKAIREILERSEKLSAEFVSRIDGVLVFRPLSGRSRAKLTALQTIGVAREYGLELCDADAKIIAKLHLLATTAKDARNAKSKIAAKLAEPFIEARQERRLKTIRLDIDKDGNPVVSPFEKT